MSDIDIVDFSDNQSPKKIPFKIDDDIFYASGVLPAAAGLMMMRFSSEKPEVQAAQVPIILDMILMEESAERFAQRMRSSKDPISMKQIGDVFRYLVEKTSARPTEQPNGSTDGLAPDGTSLTVGAPQEE